MTKNKDFETLELKEKLKLVHEALEDEVYSALALHQGGLEVVDIDGLIVYINYQGACASCPMASTGTLMFVEHTLQQKVDERIQVKIVA